MSVTSACAEKFSLFNTHGSFKFVTDAVPCVDNCMGWWGGTKQQGCSNIMLWIATTQLHLVS